MRTKYYAIKGQQGTSKEEIAKAKRLYRAGVKCGKYPHVSDLFLSFFDVNGIVVVIMISGGIIIDNSVKL